MRIDRTKLLDALELVAPGLAKKDVLEQSNCFLFRGGEIVTFNEEACCRLASPVPSITGAVRAEPLLNLLRKLDGASIEVSMSKSGLRIKGEKTESKASRSTVYAEERFAIPESAMPSLSNLSWSKLPENVLDALALASPCVGSPKTRFALSCVHIHPEWIEASNARMVFRYPVAFGLEEPTIVRPQTLKPVVDSSMNEWAVDDDWLHFRNEQGLAVSCRRYLDQYYDLSSFLDVEGPAVKFPKGILEAVDKASIFLPADGVVEVELRANRVAVKGQGAAGSYEERRAAEYDGKPIRFVTTPELLKQTIERSEDCVIGPKSLKVQSDYWVFVSYIGAPEDESDDQ